MLLAIDFLNEVADNLGIPQIDTLEKPTNQYLPEHRKLLRTTNRVLKTAGGYNNWPLLRDTGQIVLVASVETSATTDEYVTVAQNSQTMTIDNVTWDKTYIGRAIQVSGDDYVYRITAVPTPTSVTLHRAWVNASVAASDEKTCTVAMDQYVLPADYSRPVGSFKSFFMPYNVRPVTNDEFSDVRRDRRDIRLADPEIFTLYGLQNGRQVLHFDPFPENARMLEYEYQKVHPKIDSDQDQIMYPFQYIETLMEAVQYLAERDYKDSPKAETILRDMLRNHNLSQSNAGPTQTVAAIRPSQHMRRSMRVAYGYPHTSIDWGDAFDTGAKNGF